MFGINLLSVSLFKIEPMANRKSNQFTLRLPPALLEELETTAAKSGFSEQAIVEALIRSFIADSKRGDLSIPFRLATKPDEKNAPIGAARDASDPPSSSAFSLNEDPPARAEEKPATGPRGKLRTMIQREKSNPAKK